MSVRTDVQTPTGTYAVVLFGHSDGFMLMLTFYPTEDGVTGVEFDERVENMLLGVFTDEDAAKAAHRAVTAAMISVATSSKESTNG